MKDEPADLSVADVEAILSEHWGISDVSIRYAPVGFGSYHWIASSAAGPRWFVTADRLDSSGHIIGDIFAALSAAATSVATLASLPGLPFVVAGLPALSGSLLLRVRENWALQVFPYLVGKSSSFGAWENPAEREQIAQVLGTLHSVDPPNTLQRWEFAIPNRSVLDELDKKWEAGPLGEEARELLQSESALISRTFARYDALAVDVAASDDPWVVSHGEPHRGNALRTAEGQLLLIDWDTVLLAPRERDLVNAYGAAPELLPAYRSTAGPVTPNPSAIELFQLWWPLAEFGAYADRFHRPHTGTEDDVASLGYLKDNLTYAATLMP